MPNTLLKKIKIFTGGIGNISPPGGGTIVGVIGSGTLNYVAKFTPNGTSVGNSILFDDGTNIGLGLTSLTAKLHIQGSDSTSSNYALKVDNSSNTPLLYVRNDGVSKFTSILDGTGSGIDNYSFASTSGGLKISYYSQAGSTAYLDFFTNNILGTRVQEFSGYYSVNAKNRFSIKTLSDNKTHLLMDGSSGFIGVGSDYFTPTAQLHVQGINSTSSNYALKIDNLSLTPLLYVRNDGRISAPLIQTGNIGLVSGDLYVDTAANILANGDRVVGRKV